MDVGLRLLRYFVAVAEELHFTKAAERLHVSQPALSKQIHQLETELRIDLFQRTSRQVQLTEAGVALLPHARKLLLDWSEAVRLTRDAAAAAARTLRVGFIANGANELTPQILDTFARRHPDWRVRMSQSPWSDPTAGLIDGDVDVALLRWPVPGAEHLHTEVLLTEDRWVALPARHPLAQQDVVRFEQLLDEPFIATPSESGAWRDYWLAVDQRGGHPVVIGVEVKSSDEWMEALANGFGVCFTAASTARYYPRPGVAYRPVDRISPTQVVVAWRRDDQRRIVRNFVEACQELAEPAVTSAIPAPS